MTAASRRTLALEIHDAGLVAVTEDGPLARTPPTPGYAVIDGKAVIAGTDAFYCSRLRPRFVHHRFWQELDTSTLPRPFPRGLSVADLAHAHLSGFWQSLGTEAESVVLTIPGTFSERQLGLVLGIARACGIPVDGMADAAVSSGAAYSAPEMLHIDVHLHRLVATRLRQHDGKVERCQVETDDDVGLVVLHDAVARRLAELFVNATRFDPLHSAASEQALYSRLNDWLARLRAEEGIEIKTEVGRHRHTLEVTRAEILTALEPFYERVLDLVHSCRRGSEPIAFLLTHRLAGLPGLEQRLTGLSGVDWKVLAPGASGLGALKSHDDIATPGEEALSFVTGVSVHGDAVRWPAGPGAAKVIANGHVPTHLVRDGLAYSVTGDPFLAAAPWSTNGHGATAPSCQVFQQDAAVIAVVPEDSRDVFLNGEEVRGRVELAAGDRLKLGASRPLELHLIKVVS